MLARARIATGNAFLRKGQYFLLLYSSKDIFLKWRNAKHLLGLYKFLNYTFKGNIDY